MVVSQVELIVLSQWLRRKSLSSAVMREDVCKDLTVVSKSSSKRLLKSASFFLKDSVPLLVVAMEGGDLSDDVARVLQDVSITSILPQPHQLVFGGD